MASRKFDVIIIGAGPAGVAAAGALAGDGISVCLIEAGAYAGAENWSGCVYFAESLAQEDCFGHAAVAAAPFERQVVRRGTLVLNGSDEVGLTLEDPKAFRHCYTVLRPLYDPYFAGLARSRGAALLTGTTVTSLIRRMGRVTGVMTDRGALFADVVFLAEGDASHLVRSEDLERVRHPHYLQGVKAVLSLPPEEIDRRFGLDRRAGAAYEFLVRNGSIAGRTAALNLGGFLYTNRDSLSLGYVLPLDNLAKRFRGDHGRLLEWMRSLPTVAELTKDGRLSAYGTKIIRSGGWRERPVLVEDGLAVGGSSANLGIDLPFPNFTGPAAATGLFFARAVRQLLKEGRSFQARNLKRAYLDPLAQSVYGRNARHLSRWPRYFGGSRVLFGRTADLACGTARFLSAGGVVRTGRFLRGHFLSPRGLRELLADTFAAARSLRLVKPLVTSLADPRTAGAWLVNQFRRAPAPAPGLGLIVNIGGRKVDPGGLPWPVGGLVRRTAPALGSAVAGFYANDDVPLERKLRDALRTILRSFRLTDLVVLPAFGLLLLLAGIGTALMDAFRFYILKTPVEKFLAEPVMAYGESQRKVRDIDAAKPSATLEAKLATNTSLVGGKPHIRTLWPGPIAKHGEISQAALWWICPARVYEYDAPLVGRGRVAVNWENCIKCETCWRAEPDRALWGRFTDHRLIYRPESQAIDDLIAAQISRQASGETLPPAAENDRTLRYLDGRIARSLDAVMAAAAAFREAVGRLPLSADGGRRSWTAALGTRLLERMQAAESLLRGDRRGDAADELSGERTNIGQRLDDGRLFHALYSVARLEHLLRSWTGDCIPRVEKPAVVPFVTADDASRLFPDRVVKEWEESPVPPEWCAKLGQFIDTHRHPARPAVRALSSVSPALGLMAAVRIQADRLLQKAGKDPVPGAVAWTSGDVDVLDTEGESKLVGRADLVPLAGADSLLLTVQDRAFLIPLDREGVTVTPEPAIGFRAAGLSRVDLSCTVVSADIFPAGRRGGIDPFFYLAVALGAGDYLFRRALEHAAGRVQFPGQMLDTGGRDGIAKLGAVKALLSRTGAWRLMLETLSDASGRIAHSGPGGDQPLFSMLCAAAAAMAFGPDNGCMAYDAGQVFGGFAFSEDDLLSRFYRDSSLFRFLDPGVNAAAGLQEKLSGADLGVVLRDELGDLGPVSGAPLGPLKERWNTVRQSFDGLPAGTDGTLRGNAAALLLGTRALLASTERAISGGESREHEAASVEVLLGLAEQAIARAALSAGMGAVPPDAVFPTAPDIRAAALDRDYDAFCERPGTPHRSGAFLVSVFDRSPRYVPEMQLHDPKLRQRWTELADWFKTNAANRTFEGLRFERFVEKMHNLPPEIIEAVKRNRWLATYVPESEDGLGWRKAEYYILNSAAGSFGDAAVCLLIMASTSIGTTPVLLGLEDELPRVREELAPLDADPKRLGEIGSRIKRLVATFRSPNPGWIRKEYQSVMELVDGRVRRTRVVKYLAAAFLRSFYAAGIAGRRGDFGGFMENLKHAAELFDRVMPDVRNALAELPRRERAHRLFLRNLGHGGVSAFALTEPTAGSDSGGVKTTAALRTAMLAPLPDGRYSFSPAGEIEKSRRFLIDADRVTFTAEGMAYLTPDDKPAPIRYERYNYGTDEGVRSYEYRGETCEFHDIGQVRRTPAGPAYEYYSLTGAKMWITNGSLASQFSLYALAPEGVTGFMVDRHAEGLKIGADERKTGQRGSPTNEIALDGVRVPREAVIGYEGHGQVNALETLNVGRCGLAAVAGALARKLMDETRRDLSPSEERDRLLGEAAAVQFGSESLAYYLIGLFDRPHESVRMESAIAKYACSEDVHEVIALLERAYGPAGQTERRLIEKARRDARILNIYEGTNEVQRFLILKDLIARAGDWPELPEPPQDEAALLLARWKNRLRGNVLEAARRFGDAAWADAMLQPALFPLAEMAGEILRLECVLYRSEWLAERKGRLGAAYADPLLAAAKRAADRATAALEHLDRSFERSWQQVSNDIDAPEVRAADAALDRAALKEEPGTALPRPARSTLRVLAIVRLSAVLSPAPRIESGSLKELLWDADPLDRCALDQALALKAPEGPTASVDALFIGGPEHEDLCRTVACRADRLLRLDAGVPSPGILAAAIRDLEIAGKYDLIIAGDRSLDGGHGLAAFLSGALGRPSRSLARLVDDGAGSVPAGASGPVVVGITAPAGPVRPVIGDILDSLSRPAQVLRPAAPRTQPPAARFSRPSGAAASAETIATVKDAAAFLKRFAAAAGSGRAEEYTGTVEQSTLAGENAAWAIVDGEDPKADLAALRGCRTGADLFGRTACALIAAPRDRWSSLLGLARAGGVQTAWCVDTKDGVLSAEGKRQVLARAVRTIGDPLVLAGPDWTDAAAFEAGTRAEDRPVPLIADITHLDRTAGGALEASAPAYGGRLLRNLGISDSGAFLIMSPEAELQRQEVHPDFAAREASLELRPEWTVPAPPPQPPTLGRAEVIVDLGYGIKDRSGLALATELKKKLESMGLEPMFGATRKVTQDLKLQPLEAQIGQTGTRVNPKLILALGISGAPQHVDWIGTRAEIFCFNKDTEAPLMQLNRTRPAPRVHPIAGDLFVTVRELIGLLG